MQLFILFESASGYAIFEKEEYDEMGGDLSKVQSSITQMDRFSKIIKLRAYWPFPTGEIALSNISAIAKQDCPAELATFLETHLPAVKSKQKFALGIIDAKFGQA